MPLPTDPLLAQQWHLKQTILGLLDLNLFGVWNPVEGPAYTGAGTTTVIIDDGFDYNHPDFDNYDQSLDYDFEFDTLDPFGTASSAQGTATAGLIGAAADGSGAVGAAFGTSLVGYRTAEFITDAWLQDIGDAISSAAINAVADVANISQSISNDNNSEFGFGYDPLRFDQIEASINSAVDSGRGGLGMTIVMQAGNRRGDDYDVNADDWTNDTRQVVVAAVDQNGFVSTYSSYGAAILVSAFGTPGEVLTTDRVGEDGFDDGDFTSTFDGAGAASAMVAGVVTLMYEANAGLGWRDVQSILGVSARQVGSEVGAGPAGSEKFAWGFNAAGTWNGGGQHFSNDYGYGLVDALAAVRLAETWLLTGEAAAISSNEFTNTVDVLNTTATIPGGDANGLTFSGNAAFDDAVKRVTVTMTFSTTSLEDVEVYLTSPDGTVSQLIAGTAGSADFDGTWTFESQAFRGERAAGAWSVRVVDAAKADVLTVSDIVIQTFGADTTNDRYVFTDEYSDYAGLFGHTTAISDSNGGTDTVNAAAVTSASVIRLDGVAGVIDGISVTFADIEHAIGGDGADEIFGNAGSNQLFGMRGTDRLFGGEGSDTLDGGTGNDVFLIAAQVDFDGDTIEGGADADTIRFTSTTAAASLVLTSKVTGVEFVEIADAAGDRTGTTPLDLDVAQVNNGLTIRGNDGDNAITGTELADTFDGGSGKDTINGGGGIDTLNGGDGDDTLNGGNETEDVFGGDGSDILVVGLAEGNDKLDGGNDVDTADFSALTAFDLKVDLAAGTWGDLSFVFATLVDIENAITSSGNDTLVGNAKANSFTGNGGTDTLSGGIGNDTLNGGADSDTLNGGSEDDTLNGGAGADKQNGGSGIDIFLIGLSADFAGDTIAGASGTDRIRFTSTKAGDTLTLTSAVTQVEIAEIADTTGNFKGMTALNISAAAVATAMTLSGNDGANTLTGTALGDMLNGNGGIDTLSGGAGIDTLVGGADADTLNSGSEDDTLIGGAGADKQNGGSGNDIFLIGLSADFAGDTIAGASGTDRIRFTSTKAGETLTLTNAVTLVEIAEITDAAGGITSTLALNLNAAAVATGMTLTGNDGANTVTGTTQADEINGNAGNDTLSGGAGNDILYGRGDNDVLNGGADNDLLNGGSGDDILNGGSGNDEFVGASGKDTLIGGSGLDSFFFNKSLGPTNIDTIQGFNHNDDVILLDDDIFLTIGPVGALSAGFFRAATAALDANDRIIYDASTNGLFYDSDGVGGVAQIQFAIITGIVGGLTTADFAVIS